MAATCSPCWDSPTTRSWRCASSTRPSTTCVSFRPWVRSSTTRWLLGRACNLCDSIARGSPTSCSFCLCECGRRRRSTMCAGCVRTWSRTPTGRSWSSITESHRVSGARSGSSHRSEGLNVWRRSIYLRILRCMSWGRRYSLGVKQKRKKLKR